MDAQFIDDTKALREFVESLPDCNENWPSLYIDLEGNDLCRRGTLSLLTILVEPRHTVHIIDVTKLGNEAFNTTDAEGRSVKSILEYDNIIKVFFDVRNDSDALFSHYDVRVAGIEDIQLMELASRTSSKRLVHGLARCIENDAKIEYEERRRSKEIKEQGRRLFAPERGGSYAIFDRRPLPDEMKEYCVQDVRLLPGLREVYLAKLCDAWWLKIQEETAARIRLSQNPNYNGKGRHIAEAPRGWINWYPSQEERYVKAIVDEKRSPPKTTTTAATVTSDASPSTESAAVVAQHPLSVTAALEAMKIEPVLEFLKTHRPQLNSSGDFLDEFESIVRYSPNFSDDDRNGTGPDLTACDKECGYCGRCMY